MFLIPENTLYFYFYNFLSKIANKKKIMHKIIDSARKKCYTGKKIGEDYGK